MIAFKDLLLLLLLAHADARPEQVTLEWAESLETTMSALTTETAPTLSTQTIDMAFGTTAAVVGERQGEAARAEMVTSATPEAAVAAATAAAPTSPPAVATTTPDVAAASASASGAVAAAPLAGASNLPESQRNCFYAEEQLCLNWHQYQPQHNATSEDPNRSDPASMDASDAHATLGVSDSNLTAYNESQSRDRDTNSCQCREHPTRPNSWYCCNITSITNQVATCSNISKWTHLHIRNHTAQEFLLSTSSYRALTSLAVTDGLINKLTSVFPRHSSLKCLNMTSNNITEIDPRAIKDVNHLEYIGLANNHLTRVMHRNQKKNIALDISGNKRMLCEPLNEVIHTEAFMFEKPESSLCVYNATHKWFNSTDYVSVKQLESIKKCSTECPIIPNYGNCSCNMYGIMIIQDDQSRTGCNVDCSNLGLIELPSQLPDNTFTLNISNNKISSLGDHFHRNPTYYNIVKLMADNNHISSIYEFEGTKFIEHFQRLYIRNNSLSKIPEYFLNNALMDTDIGRRIYLAENRLQCDCNSAKTLQNWLKERSTDIPDYMDIRCRNLPQSVIELQEIKLCQSPPDWTDYIYYLIAAEVILLLALITKVSYDYWVFKTAGYLPWPASKMPKLPCDWLCES